MLRSLFTVALSASMLLSVQAMADVYKYKDEHGNVLYTDKPATLPAERLNVRTQRTDTVALQERQAEEEARRQAAEEDRQRRSTQRADQRNAAELSATAKAEQCAKARERYDSYMMSQRLYEELPGGQRRYLSDAELDAARASAKASMEVLCK
jgi:ABC-type multidrug transport system ATPase subunit